MKKSINECFPQVLPYKTYGGAHRALMPFWDFITERNISYGVFAVPDGFIPVVVLTAATEDCRKTFASNTRICVEKT